MFILSVSVECFLLIFSFSIILYVCSDDTKNQQLTERQKLRLHVKQLKSLPKLSKEDRKRKYGNLILLVISIYCSIIDLSACII